MRDWENCWGTLEVKKIIKNRFFSLFASPRTIKTFFLPSSSLFLCFSFVFHQFSFSNSCRRERKSWKVIEKYRQMWTKLLKTIFFFGWLNDKLLVLFSIAPEASSKHDEIIRQKKLPKNLRFFFFSSSWFLPFFLLFITKLFCFFFFFFFFVFKFSFRNKMSSNKCK